MFVLIVRGVTTFSVVSKELFAFKIIIFPLKPFYEIKGGAQYAFSFRRKIMTVNGLSIHFLGKYFTY